MLPINRTTILRLLLPAFFLLFSSAMWAQGQKLPFSGTVVDYSTGEPLPFVQIAVKNSSNGTLSDINGHFSLTLSQSDSIVEFRSMGYTSQTYTVGSKRSRIRILMEPTSHTLQTVEISEKKGKKDRYRRKDNPAVELLQEVLARKDSINIYSYGDFSRKGYDKFTFSLDQFHPDFSTHKLWKHFPFVEKYISPTLFDGTEVLNLAIRERLLEQDCENQNLRTLTTAIRSEGIGVRLDREGFDGDLHELFPPVDIFSNNINLLDEQFVSPLSSTLGNGLYHYFITDTVLIDSLPCIELSFVPVGNGSFGFMGAMYITNDGTYSLRRYSMKVPENSSFNFVRDFHVLQDFEPDSLGRFLPTKAHLYGRFYVGKRIKQVYVHQYWQFYDYQFKDQKVPLPDSIFTPLVTNYTLPRAHKVLRRDWNARRPICLTLSETFLDSIRFEFMRMPAIRHTAHVLEVIGMGYIHTSYPIDSSKFEIGNIYNFVSHNGLEGYRLRLGGTTTVKLSNRNFFDGYVAYGLLDKKPKFNLSYIHTFEPKKYYPTESPLGYISFNATYDVESPGLSFEQFARDNLLMWTDEVVPSQYVADFQVRLRKRWPSNIGIDTWLGAQEIWPNVGLNYYRVLPQGNQRVEDLFHTQGALRLSYSPRISTGGRSGEGSLLNIAGSAANFSLGHEIGLLDGFFYNRTTAIASGRLWLSALGYLDLRAQAGMIWNSVPMPKLFVPTGNVSQFIFDGSFSTMKPMEFVMDRYAELFATYHLKGLILNHIPFIRRFRLREIVSFNILYGGISPKNIPGEGPDGLYLLPSNVSYLSHTPYMEWGVGVENILKVLNIQYVRRISYLDGVSQPWTIKLGFSFTM